MTVHSRSQPVHYPSWSDHLQVTLRDERPLSFLVDSLPADVLIGITRFLLGSDLLRLSACNHCLHRLLRDNEVWKHRLRIDPAHGLAKDQYCRTTSLLFRGSVYVQGAIGFDNVPLPLGLFPRRRDISFDVWFALMPHASLRTGVLIGAQDIRAAVSSRLSPSHSECFAYIDEKQRLHCSVLRDKPVITSALEPLRWYHLALTYDHRLQEQCVYLNGQFIHTMDGTTEFPWLQHTQLGVGFLEHNRWCRFRGLIDDFHISYSVWTPEQITRLANGQQIHAPMAFALTRDLDRHTVSHQGSWLQVSCTRPAERHVEILRCWKPRLPAAPYQRPVYTPGITTPTRSLWQLVRQCL